MFFIEAQFSHAVHTRFHSPTTRTGRDDWFDESVYKPNLGDAHDDPHAMFQNAGSQNCGILSAPLAKGDLIDL